MTIKQIEKEFEIPIDKLIKDCFTPDYMNKVMSITYLKNFLGISYPTLYGVIEKYHIKSPYNPPYFCPPEYEDNCWVKYGISIEGYLKSRHLWMSMEEMAIDLKTTKETIHAKMNKLKIKGKEVKITAYRRKRGKWSLREDRI